MMMMLLRRRGDVGRLSLATLTFLGLFGACEGAATSADSLTDSHERQGNRIQRDAQGPNPSNATHDAVVDDALGPADDGVMGVCVGEVCAADENHAPDPSTWGPYPVGVRTFMIESLGWDGAARQLLTEVWYPATEEVRDGPFELIDLYARSPDEAKARLEGLPLPPIPTEQVREAPIRSSDGPYPMVLFSHGAYGIRFQSIFFTAYLASHGYVVPSVDHVDNTLFDLIVRGYDTESVALHALDRPLDAKAAIGKMLERNETPGDFFHGVIDPERLAVAGHSFGGLTSFMAAIDEPNVLAVVPMTPETRPLFLLGYDLYEFNVPTMMMVSSLDRTLPHEMASMPGYEKIPAEKHYFNLKTGGHFSYSDICILDLELVAETLLLEEATAILEDGCGEINILSEHAHPIIRQFAIGFLNHHLRKSVGSMDWYSPEAAMQYRDVMVFESVVP